MLDKFRLPERPDDRGGRASVLLGFVEGEFDCNDARLNGLGHSFWKSQEFYLLGVELPCGDK